MHTHVRAKPAPYLTNEVHTLCLHHKHLILEQVLLRAVRLLRPAAGTFSHADCIRTTLLDDVHGLTVHVAAGKRLPDAIFNFCLGTSRMQH